MEGHQLEDNRCPICGKNTSRGKAGGKICFDCVNRRRTEMRKSGIKTVPFLVDIPENTLELEITAKVYINGQILKYGTEITDLTEIRKGMIAGEEYNAANAMYVLTDKAKKELGIE